MKNISLNSTLNTKVSTSDLVIKMNKDVVDVAGAQEGEEGV